MTMMILRRKGLGLGSCKGLSQASENISFVRNDRLHTVNPDNISCWIRWGCTSTVPRVRNNESEIPVIQPASAIHTVNDKAGFRMMCQEEGLSVPYSFNTIEGSTRLPDKTIVRSAKHSRGRNLWVFENDLTSMIQRIGQLGENNWYAAEFIPKVAEYRVYVVCGKVVWVCTKDVEDPTQPAWNRARTGCEFINVTWGSWPLDVVKAAVDCFNLSGLHFGGVDVVVSEEGTPYVIEINSAASLPMFEGGVSYRQKRVAKAFDWHYENGWDQLEQDETIDSWRGWIHPGAHS